MGGWSRSLRKSGMGVTGCTVRPRLWQIPCSLAPWLRLWMTSTRHVSQVSVLVKVYEIVVVTVVAVVVVVNNNNIVVVVVVVVAWVSVCVYCC